MVSALQISRAIREPGYRPPGPGSAPPPPFLTKPTTVARAAVRAYHRSGAGAATSYLAGSLGGWLDHPNKSMAGNARNTLDGLANYISADREDGRATRTLDTNTAVTLAAGDVKVRFDLVLNDGSGVAGRVVLWDGPDFSDKDAPVIAAIYAQALTALHPATTATTIGIWQARRGHVMEIPVAAALQRLPTANAVLARL